MNRSAQMWSGPLAVTLVVVCNFGQLLRADVLEPSEQLTIQAHKSGVGIVAVSRNGSWVASAGIADNLVKIWDAQYGNQIATLSGHRSRVTSVAFDPTGHRLASASYDGTVRIWDIGAQVLNLVLHVDEPVMDVTFSHDGQVVVGACMSRKSAPVVMWDANNGHPLQRWQLDDDTILSVAISEDDKQIAWGEEATLGIWCRSSGKRLHSLHIGEAGVGCVRFSPDNTHIAIGNCEGIVTIWNVAKRRRTRTLDAKKKVRSLCFSPDGRWLAVPSNEDSIRIWDCLDHKEPEVLYGHKSKVTGVAIARDGRVVSCGRDGTIRVWRKLK